MTTNFTRARGDLRRAARAAARRGVLSYEEAVAEGGLVYARCLREFRPGRCATFRTFLRYRLKVDLLLAAREEVRQRYGLRKDRKTPILKERVAYTPQSSDGDWTSELSDEAWRVVRYTLSLDPGLRPAQVKSKLRKCLESLGWAAQDILETFKEIGECLP